MVKSKTVFVIGAGASKEVGLPIGSELTTVIMQRLHVQERNDGVIIYDDAVRSALMQTLPHQTLPHNGISRMAAYINACKLIKSSMPLAPSIDNFLDTHKESKDVEICGKIGIASSILTAERSSSLFFDTSKGL